MMKMKTAHSNLNVFLSLTVLVCGVMSQSCNVTNLNDNDDEGDKYFATEHENNCYVFVLEKKEAEEARQMCRDIGGHLTDINKNTQGFLESFIQEAKNNFKELHQDFWIGLIWSSALDLYYWDNGANTDSFGHSDLSFYTGGSCVILKKEFKWDNIGCGSKNSFICKIPPTCEQQSQSAVINDTACLQLCKTVIEKHRNNSTPRPTTTPTTPPAAPTDSTVNVTSVTNVTDEDNGEDAGGKDGSGGNGERQTGEEDGEKSCCDKDIIQVIILPAVLAAVLAFSLLFNIVLACVLVRRKRQYRALKYKSKKAVPMVDILNADKVGARKELRSQSDTSQLCSTDELLYANDSDYNTEKNRENEVEGRGGQASKNDNNFHNNTSEGMGNIYGNSQINGVTGEGPTYSSVTPGEDDRMKGKSSSDNYAEPIKIGGGKANASRPSEAKKHSDKTPSSAKSNETYSTLNRNGDQGGGNLELSAMGHVYGMHSASAPFSGSGALHSTGTKDTGPGADTGSDEYSKLNRGEHSANAGDPQHVCGLQSASVPFDDTVEYQNQETKNQASVYESYT